MPKARILVVEDKSVIAQSLIDDLQSKEYPTPQKALTGEQAIEIMQKKPLTVDIVLMDIHLGDGEMDGIDTAAKIKEIHEGMPIIYISNYTDPPTLERAKKTNPADFCKKPIEIENLVLSIEIAYYNCYGGNNLKSAAKGDDKQLFFEGNDRIYIPYAYTYRRVDLDQLLKVTASTAQCILYTKEATYYLNMPLGKFESLCQHRNLIRINNSNIINTEKIVVFGNLTFVKIETQDGGVERINIGGGRYRQNMIDRFPFFQSKSVGK